MSAPETCAYCDAPAVIAIIAAMGPALDVCARHGDAADAELDAIIERANGGTCCPLHDDEADDPITDRSAECQLMYAWGTGDGQWLDDGTGTPEEGVQDAGWEIIHRLEQYPGALLVRPRTERTALYIVADLDDGPWAVRVAS